MRSARSHRVSGRFSFFPSSRRRGRSVTYLACIGALLGSMTVLSACGSSTKSSHVGATKPAESIGDYAKRFEADVATGRCARLQALGFRGGRECAALVPKLRGLKVLATASYGTGGVIDVTDAQFGAKGGTFVVELGPGNKWKVLDGYEVGHRTVGTTAKNRSGFDETLNRTVAALRKKDCPAFIKYALTASNGQSACTQPFASAIAKALTANPTAVPTSLGGNADFQFYSIKLKGYPGHPGQSYLTFPVSTTAQGPDVTFPYVALPPRLGG
jgi:hypothetical protein